jgi:hypothetical protein
MDERFLNEYQDYISEGDLQKVLQMSRNQFEAEEEFRQSVARTLSEGNNWGRECKNNKSNIKEKK